MAGEISEIVALIVTLILAILSAFFGRQYKAATDGLSKLERRTGEIHGLISAIEEAVRDKKVTKKEAARIIEKIHGLVEEE